MTFFRSFFDVFLTSFFNALLDRFWCQLAPNLASKIDQKSIQEPSKIYPKFYLVSSTFLNRFLIDFGSNLGTSNPPFTCKKSWFLKLFMILLDCLLDGFWSQLGSILGGFGEPSWDQVGTKLLQKSIQKPIKKMIAFCIDFWNNFVRIWCQLGSQHGAKKVCYVGLCWLLEPSWSQDAPGTPQGDPQDWFWIDLGQILDRF